MKTTEIKKNYVFNTSNYELDAEQTEDGRYTGPFWVNDLIGLGYKGERINEIDSIWVPLEERNKGLGSSLIQDYVKNIPSNEFIIVLAGSNCLEYPEEPCYEEIQKILVNLDRFYTQNNFIDVNDIIGSYETMRVYLYQNEKGLKFINDVNEKWEKGVDYAKL